MYQNNFQRNEVCEIFPLSNIANISLFKNVCKYSFKLLLHIKES